MSKRIVTLLILLALCVSFVGCSTEGAPDVKVPKDTLADIQDYVDGDAVYFMPSLEYAKQAISEMGLKGDAAFNEFITTWGEYAELPKTLVESYRDKIMASDSKVSEDEATELAKALIKEELVVATAFNTLCDGKAITDEVRAAAAEDFGIDAGDSAEGTVSTDTYAIDAFIKHKTVAAYIAGEELPYGILTREEAAEESTEVSE